MIAISDYIINREPAMIAIKDSSKRAMIAIIDRYLHRKPVTIAISTGGHGHQQYFSLRVQRPKVTSNQSLL